MLNIEITNVNFSYNVGVIERVEVHFTSSDESYQMSVSGYIPLSNTEYAGNEGFSDLKNIVKQKLSEKLGLNVD